MFSIGVDLGQRRDYSAIAVVERLNAAAGPFDYVRWAAPQPPPPAEWVVRHLERMP